MKKIEHVETDVKCRLEEGCKLFVALKGIMRCRTLGEEAKRKGLNEVVIDTSVLYGRKREEKVEGF